MLKCAQMGSRTFYLRIIFRDLSRSACVVPISRLSALETRFLPFFQASWPTSERTSTADFHDHKAASFLRPPAAVATVAPETAALLAASTHGPSIRPPSPVYTAATPSPSPCRWSPREPAMAGAGSHGAGQSCGMSGTTPADLASPLRPDTGCWPGARPTPRTGEYRG